MHIILPSYIMTRTNSSWWVPNGPAHLQMVFCFTNEPSKNLTQLHFYHTDSMTGVVVSGGMDTNRFNTSNVEFLEMNTNKWINLPSLSCGRRGHTMTTIDGRMAIAGGATTGVRGKDKFLDDVEVFDGRRWRTAAYRMDQPRNGANLIKIPIRSFFTG